MKAARITGPATIGIIESAPPAPRDEEVLVEPVFVGLCGSDLSYFRKGANGSFVIREPLTIGHEIVGRVVSAGKDSYGDYRAGDRVAVHPVWPTPLPGGSEVPEYLVAEKPHFLGSASTTPHTQGGLVELLAVRGERLRRIPDRLPLERAALAEPLSVVLHALDRHTGGFDGARVLVCGAGPIGLLAAVALKHGGAARVGMTDLHTRPLEVARAVGADVVYRVGDEGNSVPEAQFDIAIEATGAPASLDASLRALRPGGVLIQLGMLAAGGITADLAQVVVKELTVLGTHRFLGELDAAIALLADAPECDAIVTHVVALDQIEDALALAGDGATSSKVLVSIAAVS
ncbi:L-idonate 5-dehydrogenase [Microbacteriaceae bacterium SG_E_30_P1]|uniref:L-idonate 5-dehydrogenase n=1 Tax=Antiquaquibacter oligotrophicus TaxID=2880260 RepID=A0ABT6KQ33_9MICO|nr:zinc-binding dehydrogenase [Antiquaquibacter oligotrophicus]MDH6182090.1 L-idonate 5-dehydrogenase [Antiquaquibacter oligotrophicus]UDF12245.1 zinc-binding dehydrogenase [Antiquaquibacter oligotrophicus]